MKRSTKIVWISAVVLTIIIAAVAGIIVYFTAFNKKSSQSSPPAVPGSGLNSESNPDATPTPTIATSPSVPPKADANTSITTNPPSTTVPPSTQIAFDHLSHAVPGYKYTAVDFDGDNYENVQLDGSRSHTHYTEGDPPVQGRLVYMNWFNNDTKKSLASNDSKPLIKFPVGTTIIGLTVQDNSRDSHTAYAKVIVERPILSGAYCYYYPGSDTTNVISIDDDISKGLQATYAHITNDIAFVDDSSFPSIVQASKFQTRCNFVVTPDDSSDDEDENIVSFSITHYGPIRLIVNDKVVLQSTANGEETTSGTISLPKGNHYASLMYSRSSSAAGKLVMDMVNGGSIRHDASKIIPVITAIEPLTSTLEGGGSAKITGIGMQNNPRVDFGGTNLDIDTEISKENEKFIIVPKSEKAKRIDVRVFNNVGYSNALPFEYQTDGKPPIIFKESDMKMADGSKLDIQLITGIKYGPDHRYYMSAIHSTIYSMETDAELRVLDVCKSSSLGLNRAILGMAFNPSDDPDEFNLYVSGSILEWKEKERLDSPKAWANGEIALVQKNVNGACLGKVKTIISGLPVTDHDHGVNGLLFDQDGKLHIQVGGFTNAGVTHEVKLGGLDGNPLSGASLIADITRPNFNGKIEYSSSNPAIARQISGDVSVYMAGLRNSFGITLHSNGFIYATDNGASVGFGDMSLSCTEQDVLVGENLHDELVKVIKGKYAGHPNRNRGRDDPRQCVFRADKKSDSFYQAPVATFESSTNGIIEYTANTFGSQLKGDIICSKFSTQESEGKVFRVQLNGNGDLKSGPDEMWPKSGLTVVMSPYGDLISPRVFGKRIILLKAQRQNGKLIPSFIAVTPFRGPRKGGNWVIITGEDFTTGATATFNGKKCLDTTQVTSDKRSFRCKVPPAASGVTNVKVGLEFTDVRLNVPPGDGTDYLYSNV